MVKYNNLVFNSGVPTEPDVRKLIETFNELNEGMVITKDEISKTLGFGEGYRWHTVVSAWRKRLYRERTILLDAVRSKGYRVADPELCICIAGAKYKSGQRHIRRAGEICIKTDSARLSPESRRAQDHIVCSTAACTLAMATKAKEFRCDDAMKRVT